MPNSSTGDERAAAGNGSQSACQNGFARDSSQLEDLGLRFTGDPM